MRLALEETANGLNAFAKQAATDAMRETAEATYDKAKTLALARLNTTAEQYLDALEFNEVSPGIWVIGLLEEAGHLEDGYPPFDQKPGLLKNAKKVSKCVLNPRNKVLTDVGYKKIKDIKPGDMVLTHSGKFRPVIELQKTKAGIGTEYVRIMPKSASKTNTGCAHNDLVSPAFSVTSDHLVLTKDGWKQAGSITKKDLLAVPADSGRKCKCCDEPLPINAFDIDCCLNNSCARTIGVKEGRMLNRTKEQRAEAARKGHITTKSRGYYEKDDWGTRNPDILQKRRNECAQAIRDRSIDGEWHPEVFFEKILKGYGINFIREYRVQLGTHNKKTNSKTNKKTVNVPTYGFIDFLFPDLGLAIELDGKYWHSLDGAKIRDAKKDTYCKNNGIRLIRITSHKIYKHGDKIARAISNLSKNHSGELCITYVKINKITKGIVNRPDHVYANKYDIILDADEHSFCCETVFIHNSGFKYRSIPMPKKSSGKGQAGTTAGDMRNDLKRLRSALGDKGITKGADGKPLLGKILSFKRDEVGMWSSKAHQPGVPTADGGRIAMSEGSGFGSHLNSVTKYQYAHKSGKVSSQFITWRTVSENPKYKDKWIHKGFGGIKIFADLQDFAYTTLEKKLREIFD